MPLKTKDLVRPTAKLGEAHAHWAIVLHAREGQEASKTGEFDEVLILNGYKAVQWNTVWACLKKGPRTESLFQVTYRQMTASYLAAVRALNLDRVKVVHLCQLRLGGA